MDDVAKYAKTLEEIEGELMLGSIPDDLSDDDDLNIFDDQYDAANEETFGGGLNDVDDAELEDYAAQTARLRLDDPIWNNASSSSAPDAPDASTIPLPTSIFSVMKGSENDVLSPFLDQSLWGNSETSNYNIWGNSGVAKYRAQGGCEIIDSSILADSESYVNGKTNESKIPAIPQSALTLEDLERNVTNQYHQEVRESDVKLQAALPSFPTSALSLDEIENELIKCTQGISLENEKDEDSTSAKLVDEGRTAPQNQREIPSLAGIPAPFMHPMPMMPIPCIPFQNFPRVPPMHPGFLQFLPMWIDSIVRRIVLPSGFPPAPDFLYDLLNQFKNPALVYNIILRSSLPPAPQPQQYVQQHPQNFRGMQQSPSPSGLSSPQGRYQQRLPGMPSSRTIHDLAIDSFGGFLSMKEREYLINIQLKSVSADDYYYKTWKEKQIKNGWKPKPVVAEKEVTPESKQDYEERTRRMNYREMIKEVARERRERRMREKAERAAERADEDEKKQKLTLSEKFSTSLGIPSKSSTSNPRHLIDMRKSQANKSASQMTEEERKIAVAKKLRTMMIRLEGALSMLIEIGEIQESSNDELSRFKELSNEQRQMEIEVRCSTIINELMGDDMHKLLQMAKGRSVISRLLKVVGPKDQARIILGLMSAGGLVNRRMYGEIIIDLLPIIYTKLSSLHPDQFSYLVRALNVDMLKRQLLDSNVFIRDVMLTMFYVSNKNFQCLLQWAEATKFPSLALSPNKPLTSWRKALSVLNDEDIRDFAELIRDSNVKDSADLASLIEQSV